MWVMPSLNRPDRAQAAIDTMIACQVSTPGLVIVNGPQQREVYERLRLPSNWEIHHLPSNVGVCSALNLAFRFHPSEPWYGLVCDDEHVLTSGFDRILIEAAGSWNIAHGDDGWKSKDRIWTYVVCGGELLRTLGWWSLPGLFHTYHDDVQEVIAKELGLKRWCRDVHTKHVHWEQGQAVDDATYQLGRSRWQQDQQRFDVWKRNEWPAVKERLTGMISRSI